MKTEKTSKRVAAIAGRVLRVIQDNPTATQVWIQVPSYMGVTQENPMGFTLYGVFPVADLKALAASALTQAADKPSVTPKPKRRKP